MIIKGRLEISIFSDVLEVFMTTRTQVLCLSQIPHQSLVMCAQIIKTDI
jgi:hypothetical protein